MLRDRAGAYYKADMNCAEAMLMAINDEYKLGLNRAQLKLVSGFGGGMGCEDVCGALTGAVAALGPLLVENSAHGTPGFGAACAQWVQKFRADLGDDNCARLKAKYRTDEARCLQTVLLAADSFEQFWLERQQVG